MSLHIEACNRIAAVNPAQRQELQTKPVVLIVEDNSLMGKILKDTVEEIGCEAIITKNGMEALLMLRQTCPDIILLDAMMPVMDGYTTCSMIRSLDAGQNIFIVMVTGLDGEAAIARAFNAGVDDYITKPIHIPVVKHRLKKYLQSSKSKTNNTKPVPQEGSDHNFEMDLMQTAQLQQSLLPKSLSNEYVIAQSIYKPLHLVSGDFLEYFWNENNRQLSGYILDATGHGLSSAMQGFALRLLFRQAFGQGASLVENLTWLNQQIVSTEVGGTWASACLFCWDAKSRILHFASAGISTYFIVSKRQRGIIEIPGFPIGFDQNSEYQECTMPLAAGDSFFFMSDGLSELLPEICLTDQYSYKDMFGLLNMVAGSHSVWDDVSAICITVK